MNRPTVNMTGIALEIEDMLICARTVQLTEMASAMAQGRKDLLQVRTLQSGAFGAEVSYAREKKKDSSNEDLPALALDAQRKFYEAKKLMVALYEKRNQKTEEDHVVSSLEYVRVYFMNFSSMPIEHKFAVARLREIQEDPLISPEALKHIEGVFKARHII